ncbi:hypothetical protein JCM33374_g520 [Metschnikowia sp. JCM 33374]|nr:hypothetical protein JCM33374_g520 [Metschnikowia sp. JCM 33374]
MSSEDKCPVDHESRASWLEKMKSKKASAEDLQPAQPSLPTTEQPKCPVDHNARENWIGNISVSTQPISEAVEIDSGCTSEALSKDPKYTSKADLPTDREISSIPRTDDRSKWIYPSQKQFYEAMMRKNWSPQAEDMSTVVPIHNQVNELAWRHILNWERAHIENAEQKCGGLSLTSFKGDSKKLTPRAWFKMAVLGQEKPFDRHDWLVDRCGVAVPYVIDFYSGGENGGVFVDARPKIDSWEGLKLRLGRAFGFF